ncbi:MAG: translation initiation factor Sui1 [Fibrobacterales bacterium]
MAKKMNSFADLVYSTETGSTCPKCGKALKKCSCTTNSTPPKGDGIVRVGRLTKGKKGAGVTTITGLPLNDSDLKDVAKKLKQKCGTGGTIKERIIEIQGDKRDLLIPELEKMGYTVKRVGG